MSDAAQLICSLVEAALAAQRQMEGRLSTGDLLSQGPLEAALYSFRRIGLTSQFLLKKQDQRTFLFLFHLAGESTRLVHRLEFELRAAPSAPMRPGESGGVREIQLGMPSFILTGNEDVSVRQAVSDALRGGRWTTKVGVSARQVEQAAAELLTEPNKGRGPIAFRLERDGSLCLVVFVTPKDDPDGIYLYTTATRSATIFSIPSVAQDALEYEPLHRFALAVHRDLFDRTPARREPFEGPIGVIADLDAFVDQLADGYRRARGRLAADIGTATVVPSYFEIGPLRAHLRYSASFDPNQDTGATGITERTGTAAPAGTISDQMKAIVGSADIAISCNGPVQKTEVVIGMPSFVLSGGALAEFVELARKAVDDIAERFGGDSFSGEVYRDAVRARGDVVALQSFARNEPTGDLLVVWPGTGEAAGRDFLFTCHVDSDARQLEDIAKVLALGEDVAGMKITARPDPDLGTNQYGPFHNMFHAMLLWTTTLRNQ